MSKELWHNERPVKLTHREAADAALSSLDMLAVVCNAYDSGKYHAAREICNILHRMIEDEVLKAGCRRQLKLPSLMQEHSEHNLLPQFGHVVCRFGSGDMGEILFDCVFNHPSHLTHERYLEFTTWWSEPVLIEGAGGMSGLMPINGTPEIPFSKRRRMMRREIVKLIRDKMGAHYDFSEREGSRFVLKWDNFMSFTFFDSSGAEWNSRSHPEKFIYLNSHGASIVRSVAEEILRSNARSILEKVS